jgi:hypothetical protein
MGGNGFNVIGAFTHNLFDLEIESFTSRLRCFYLHELFIKLHFAFQFNWVKQPYPNSFETLENVQQNQCLF